MRHSRRSRKQKFARWFSAAPTRPLRKAPRRRSLEQLEDRYLMTATPETNPLFADQWHLFSNGQFVEQPTSPFYNQSIAVDGQDINALGAWAQGYTGKGVQVGVVDGGFDLTHEDLVFRTDLGIDLIGGDSDPSFTDVTDAHGTAVAGIIGARDNTVGGLGLAHEADIAPIRFIPGDNDLVGVPFNANLAVFLQNAGTIAQQLTEDIAPENIIDVFNHSWGYTNPDRSVTQLGGPQATPEEAQLIRNALQESVLTGRARYLGDADGDGIRDPEEFEALGVIHVAAAGNESGNTFGNVFGSIGGYRSSQYGELANSRYTIAVGAIDFDGEYENPQVGSVTGWAETGSNVLLVAPSAVIQIDNGNVLGAGGGIRTTDITGDDGYNQQPVEIFPGTTLEIDGDFLPNTNYTANFNGTSAAAPQVSATVALMLEANPDLNWREVQQILMMSARHTDQFSETWVTNPFQLFQDNYVIPQYTYYNISTDGDPASIEIENGIIPNTVDLDVIRGIYLNNPDAALPFDPMDLVEFGPMDYIEEFDPMGMEPPAIVEIVSSNVPEGIDMAQVHPDPPSLLPAQGDNTISNPISLLTNPQAATEQTDLLFTNGAGYTVSHGYGYYLEEIGYAHGVLDAALAVELAEKWDTFNVGLTEEISVTTFVQGATGSSFRIQPAARVDLGENIAPDFKVPGGISTENINAAYYQEFYKDFTTETIETFDMAKRGDVITDGPWYNPDGSLNIPNTKADTLIPFTFDSEIVDDFISVETLELRTRINAGDIDNLRITLISPDGTQTELNPFRENSGEGARIYQDPLGQQGKLVPPDEVLPGGSEDYQVGSITLANAADSAEPWTWTTNRHWGELLSVQGNGDVTRSLNDTWYLSIENWGLSEALIADEFAITVNGTRATGSRIQGKIGVDDNAQGISGYDNDENFNFERNVEFGQVSYLDPMMNVVTLDVVLDDASDSVTYGTNNPSTNRVYRTRNDVTGVDEFYAVVDRDAYFGTDDPAADAASILADVNNFLSARGINDPATDAAPSLTSDFDGRSISFQDFDYSQESFAAGVTVVATQFRSVYDANGNASVAQPTGVTQRFVTGADGNYYFDVHTTPAPPDPVASPVDYAEWFATYGETYSYEISLEGDATRDRIIQNAYTSIQNDGVGDAIFSTANGGSYNVPIFSSPGVAIGATSVIKDVNFLLTEDPTESNGVVNGQVFVDYDNNGVFDGDDVAASGVMVTMTYLEGDVEQTTTAFTDANGVYQLIRPNAGAGEQVNVAISSLPDGFSPLNPADGDQTVSLTPGSSVAANFTLNLDGANPGQAALVTGVVFNDANGDGVQGPGEGPLAGVRVYADGSGTGVNNDQYDVGEVVTTTNSAGAYTLAFTSGGTYELRVDFAQGGGEGTQQTTPTDGASGVNNGAPIFVNAISGSTVAGSVFGLRGASLDYGDLAGYASAQHVVIPTVQLGEGVDAELQQRPSSEELFDDGVTMVAAPIVPGGTIDFVVDPNFQGASLNAWIDFDNNGVFDPDEQIFTNLGLDTQSTDTVTVTASVNADLDTSATLLAARFRWGPTGVDPTGLAISGEVEDYMIYADPMSSSATAFQALTTAADYNFDGRVSQADYDVWNASFGLTGPLLTADGNGDQIVDMADYTIWADAFGATQLLMPMVAPASPPLALATAPPTLVQPGFVEEQPLGEPLVEGPRFALAFAAEPSSEVFVDDGDEAADPAATDEALLLLATVVDDEPADPIVVEDDDAGEEERRSRRDAVEDRFAERRSLRREARRSLRG